MKITQGVYMLDCCEKSHVFLIEGEDNILIDTGAPGEAGRILEEIKTIGINPKTINHILLTHHDVNHVGNARILQSETGALLWAPKEDVPYIIKKKTRLGIKRIIQMFVRYKKPIIDCIYNEYDNIEGVQVVQTPGHTPGHVIFKYRNILFTGDLFISAKGKIKLLPKSRNWNEYKLKKSLSLLKDLECEWICPSHGDPIMKNEVWEAFVEKHYEDIY